MSMDSDTENTSKQKPLLVYDGDCDFCMYWVNYWRKLTGNKVDYKPYQEAADEYTEIPVEEFQRAVQYITPEGEVSSGAKASIKTINNAKGFSFWMFLYTYLPGFSFLAEKAYTFVSTRRNFFQRASYICWGKDPEPAKYNLISWIFLRLFGVVFLVAFYSFTTQALGLIGSNGIAPVTELMTAISAQIGIERLWYVPMLFWINGSDFFIQFLCWSGMLFSVLLIANIIPRISLLVLYIIYLSFIYAGQAFMSFQWDLLLIETSLIAFFLIRYHTLGIWLLRWLTFRFMFAAGLVKIFSGDSSWFDFTAINYHLLTQPLPTPIAWYAAGLPDFFLRFSTALTLLIELFIVFMIFMPRRLRFFAAFSILFLQIAIMLTGNYNFFNITAIILCLSLFDDAAIKWLIPKKAINFMSQTTLKKAAYRITPYIAGTFAVLTIFISLIQFQIRFVGEATPALTLLNTSVAPFRVVSTYGPFAVMTKKRFEIVIEGSNDGRNWQEYQFKYKPGDIYRRPLWNTPFQPRLDWQMWFAALGSAENNPWFSRLLQRLLENSPSVTGLLKENPFKEYPPIYVRALMYDYTYSSMKEKDERGVWWDRWLTGVYFPQSSLK